jgi:hypothetical protein
MSKAIARSIDGAASPQFPFPHRGMPTRVSETPAPTVERRAIPRPPVPSLSAETILANEVRKAPLAAGMPRMVAQLSTTYYTVETFLEGAVVLRWGKELEIWRKVDVPRKSYAIAISDYQVEFVAKYSADALEALALESLECLEPAEVEAIMDDLLGERGA